MEKPILVATLSLATAAASVDPAAALDVFVGSRGGVHVGLGDHGAGLQAERWTWGT